MNIIYLMNFYVIKFILNFYLKKSFDFFYIFYHNKKIIYIKYNKYTFFIKFKFNSNSMIQFIFSIIKFDKLINNYLKSNV